MAIESTGLKRRKLLAAGTQLLKGTLLLSGGLAAAGLPLLLHDHSRENHGLLLSAYTDINGRHHVSAIDPGGRSVFSVAVPWRAHDSLLLPASQQALFFSRRPGNRLYVIDVNSGELQLTVRSPAGRHFYGHGCVSRDGRHLFATENHIDAGRGCIGIYAIDNGFRRVGEWQSFGVGPHQLALLSDGHTLAVANGGSLTRPDRARQKLTLDSMPPSLAYVDARDGQLLGQYFPPHPQQSIRHLAVGAGDRVVVGIQFEGDPQHQLPLAYVHSGEAQLLPLQADKVVWRRHRQSIASVCIDPAGNRLALTSPRGGVVSGWDLSSGELLVLQTQRDGAGVAFNALANEFVVSNGQGQVTSLAPPGFTRQAQRSHFFSRRSWDNHLNFFSRS